MKYRRAGHSGILLPTVSLGFWHNFGADADYATCRSIVHYAFDHGVTHFDLANNYGPPYGSAEETFGRILADGLRTHRDEFLVTTKAGHDMWPGPYGEWCSRKNLMASLDQSLHRMGLDYVDLFYSHRFDPETPMEETLQALVDIVRQGKALYVGISNWPKEAADFAYEYLRQRDVPCLCYQGKYNILHQDPDNQGILGAADEAGVGFVAFSPLQQGLLTDRYLKGIPEGSRMARREALTPDALTPKLLGQLKELNELAAERGESLADMALAWVLRRKEVTSVIVGTSSVEQLANNLQVFDSQTFSDEQLERIEAILTL